MAADFNTEILMKGTDEELLNMIKVLKRYETDMYNQYKEKRDCEYIMSVRINGDKSLESLSDDDLKDVVQNSQRTVKVTAEGPYGVFGLLEEVCLFEDMAVAAPNAYFNGLMFGFNAGGEQAKRGEMENECLHLYIDYPKDDFYDEEEHNEMIDTEWDAEQIYSPVTKKYRDVPEENMLKASKTESTEMENEVDDEYVAYVKSKLSYKQFIGMFGIYPEDFYEEDYEEIIDIYFSDGFIYNCEVSDIENDVCTEMDVPDQEELEKLLDRIRKLSIKTRNEFEGK